MNQNIFTFPKKDNHMMEYNEAMILILKEYLKSLN